MLWRIIRLLMRKCTTSCLINAPNVWDFMKNLSARRYVRWIAACLIQTMSNPTKFSQHVKKHCTLSEGSIWFIFIRIFHEQNLTLVQILLLLVRSEEHTSELQSRPHLVCRLLLEKKKKR